MLIAKTKEEKSLLLEDFGLMKKGSYNRKNLLSIINLNRLIQTKGCEDTFNKVYKENLCMSISSWRKITLASSFKSETLYPSFNAIIYLDSNNEILNSLILKMD